MKFRILGVALSMIGLVALAYQGITYTTRETVLGIGPVHTTADRWKRLAPPPVFGIPAVAGVIGLMLAAGRARA